MTRLLVAIVKETVATASARCFVVDDVTAAHFPSDVVSHGATAIHISELWMSHSVTAQLRVHVYLVFAAAKFWRSVDNWVRHSVTAAVVQTRDALAAAVCETWHRLSTSDVVVTVCGGVEVKALL